MKMISQKFSLKNVITRRYNNGQLAVFLYDSRSEPIAELSIEVDTVELDNDEFILKAYSENRIIIDKMVKDGLIAPTDRYVILGNHLCPICKVLNS